MAGIMVDNTVSQFNNGLLTLAAFVRDGKRLDLENQLLQNRMQLEQRRVQLEEQDFNFRKEYMNAQAERTQDNIEIDREMRRGQWDQDFGLKQKDFERSGKLVEAQTDYYLSGKERNDFGLTVQKAEYEEWLGGKSKREALRDALTARDEAQARRDRTRAVMDTGAAPLYQKKLDQDAERADIEIDNARILNQTLKAQSAMQNPEYRQRILDAAAHGDPGAIVIAERSTPAGQQLRESMMQNFGPAAALQGVDIVKLINDAEMANAKEIAKYQKKQNATTQPISDTDSSSSSSSTPPLSRGGVPFGDTDPRDKNIRLAEATAEQRLSRLLDRNRWTEKTVVTRDYAYGKPASTQSEKRRQVLMPDLKVQPQYAYDAKYHKKSFVNDLVAEARTGANNLAQETVLAELAVQMMAAKDPSKVLALFKQKGGLSFIPTEQQQVLASLHDKILADRRSK